MKLKQHVPPASEKAVVGVNLGTIKRGSERFTKELIRFSSSIVLVKDEEGTGADYMMTPGLAVCVNKLAELVIRQWGGKVKLRITEAWDENNEHSCGSSHYEGRAADMTTSDRDSAKLGVLADLAVKAGFDWVFYENKFHVHASVKRDK